MTKAIEINELDPQLLGSASLNPFPDTTSASRGQMFASSHVGQMLVIDGATERNIQTGREREYGKYTFRIAMPVDGKILDIIERYPSTIGRDSIIHNPQTLIVYEDVQTKEVGIVDLVDYSCNHQYFGFKYVDKPALKKLRVGSFVKKGEVFRDSPSITDEGGYKYGIQANVAYMTDPATAEDGIVLSEELLPRLGFRTYETRVIEWGKKEFALNLYGTEENYKCFPDIGDPVGGDNILMALRSLEPEELTLVERSRRDCMEVDTTFDRLVYAGGPGGRVVDVKIDHDLTDRNTAETHMDSQAQKYDDARRRFFQRILDVYDRLRRTQGESLQITTEFHSYIIRALSVVEENKGKRVQKQYRRTPLDTYRVEITVEYEITPSIGFKLTDCYGGKGVVCKIVPKDHMPVDEEGNRADIIMDPNSTINRANPGRLYEQYLNASARDTHKRLCGKLGIAPFTKEKAALAHIGTVSPEIIEQVWQYLLGFYAIVSPRQRAWFDEGKIEGTREEYLASIVELGISIYFPTNNQADKTVMITQLENPQLGYRPLYGPISYVGNSGKRVTTYNNVRIASVYFLLLEKIGDDWGSVASGKLQHHGVLSQLTRNDKYSNPARNQPTRVAGESEIRILISYCGTRYVLELRDRNNNPQTHRLIVDQILNAVKPTNIENLVDRRLHPFGGDKPLQIVRHLLRSSGLDFEFTPYESVSQHYSNASYTSNIEAIATDDSE